MHLVAIRCREWFGAIPWIAAVVLMAVSVLITQPVHAVELVWSQQDTGQFVIKTGSPGNVNVQTVTQTGIFARGIDFDPQSGFLYWTERNENKVRRAMLDGSQLTTLVEGVNTFGNPVSGSPRGIHIYPQLDTMFWTAQGSQEILRADLDGTNLTTAVSSVLSNQVIADTANQLLYFSNTSGSQSQQGAFSIERSTFTGGSRTVLVSGLIQVTDIQVDFDAGKLYWVDLGVNGVDDTNFKRANLDGTGVETVIDNLSDVVIQFALDPANDRFYWTANNEGAIKSARISDGGDIQSEITGLADPQALTIIPEPASAVLLLLGGAALSARRRR